MGGQVAARCGNLSAAGAVEQRDGHIAQGSHDLGRRPVAQARAIFPKGHITHVMRPIFNGPMSPNHAKQTFRISMCRRKIGNQIHDFRGGALFAGDDSRHLGYSREYKATWHAHRHSSHR